MMTRLRLESRDIGGTIIVDLMLDEFHIFSYMPGTRYIDRAFEDTRQMIVDRIQELFPETRDLHHTKWDWVEHL